MPSVPRPLSIGYPPRVFSILVPTTLSWRLTGPGDCPPVSEIRSATCEPRLHFLPHVLSHPILATLQLFPRLSAPTLLLLTCPWCSPPCSCTHSRGAGRGSSGSHCSHGVRLHTHPPGGRTGRPTMPRDGHMLALTPEDTGLHPGHCYTTYPSTPPQNHSPACSQYPSPTSLPSSQTPLTISGTTEATFHAVATSILAPPGTPATVGSSQAQGTLCSLSTAQGAALWPPKQPPTASSHTSQGQVGGAQTLSGK